MSLRKGDEGGYAVAAGEFVAAAAAVGTDEAEERWESVGQTLYQISQR